MVKWHSHCITVYSDSHLLIVYVKVSTMYYPKLFMCRNYQQYPSTPTLFRINPTPMSSAQPKSRQQPFDFDNQPQQPQQQPNETQVNLPPSDAEVLTRDIDTVVKSNLPNKVKLWDPNLFDGSDTQKLHTFILQCKLNF